MNAASQEMPHWSDERLQALYTSPEFTGRYIYAAQAITDMLRVLENTPDLRARFLAERNTNKISVF